MNLLIILMLVYLIQLKMSLEFQYLLLFKNMIPEKKDIVKT